MFYGLLAALDQAAGPHVGPRLLDPVEARLTRAAWTDRRPPGGHVAEPRPEGVLPLVVHQDRIRASLAVERIRHRLVSPFSKRACARCRCSSVIRPIVAMWAGSVMWTWWQPTS